MRWDAQLLLCVAWLGLVISVAATLLLYRLIAVGNLVLRPVSAAAAAR